VVDRRRDLTEDVSGGEKWSPGAVSCWFKLDGVGAPSADESGAINQHGRRRAGFTAIGDGEQSDGGRAESKSRERARGGESGVGELSPCAHVRDKDDRSTWDGGDRPVKRHGQLTSEPIPIS
jgi:hypothetical protein